MNLLPMLLRFRIESADDVALLIIAVVIVFGVYYFVPKYINPDITMKGLKFITFCAMIVVTFLYCLITGVFS